MSAKRIITIISVILGACAWFYHKQAVKKAPSGQKIVVYITEIDDYCQEGTVKLKGFGEYLKKRSQRRFVCIKK